MEVKIRKLETAISEAEKDVKEKDDRINKLQAHIRIKTDTSELTQLQAKLNETEKCLRTALSEKQSLQVWAKYFSHSPLISERTAADDALLSKVHLLFSMAFLE